MIVSIGDIETTRKYFEEYLKDQLGVSKYQELVSTQTFRILLHLISIAINYSSLANSVSRRESYIETATSESSLVELVYNYGFILPPLRGRRIWIKSASDIKLYTPIGLAEGYDIVPVKYESDGSVMCILGYYQESVINLTQPYQRVVLKNKGKFLSDYDMLSEGLSKIKLASDITEQIDNPKTSILRGSGFYQSRLFFGDGCLGYFRNTTLTYKRISYNEDVNNVDLSSAQFYIDNIEVLKSEPAWVNYNLDTVRTILKYVPLDTRLVREKDFESWLVWKFPQVLSARCFRKEETSSCCEADLEFILTDNSVLDIIKSEIDKRKLLGLKINYIPYSPTQGDDLVMKFKVKYFNKTNLQSEVNDYLQSTYAYKLMTEDEVIDSSLVALELSEKFYPAVFVPIEAKTCKPTLLNKTGFFKSVSCQLIEV